MAYMLLGKTNLGFSKNFVENICEVLSYYISQLKPWPMDLNDYVFVGLERSFLKVLSPHLQKENGNISYEFTFCEDHVSSKV